MQASTSNGPRPRPTLLASVALASCALAMLATATGCGRSEGSAEESPSPALRQVPPPAPPANDADSLRIAVAAMISPATTYGDYEALLAGIADDVGLPFTFVQRRTYQAVNDLLVSGQVDLAFICSGAFAALPDDANVEILAVPQVDGKPVYHSLIIVRADSEVSELSDLRGKRFAFTDPLSNTGRYYPLSRLEELGETPGTFFASTMFTGSHDRSITAVYRHLADAAAVDSLVYAKTVVEGSRYFGRLKVIETSPAFPIPPVVAPTSAPAELRARLRHALLHVHESEAGRQQLAKIGVEKFVPGDPAHYAIIRELADRASRATTP